MWLDENGYFEVDGTQRMLARTIGMQPDSSLPPDPDLWGLIHELDTATRRRFGIEHQVDCRSLNKSFFAEGCPFNLAIPRRGRYLALGINDSASAIHAPNESVPMWTFPVHDVQFRTVLRWAGRAQ